MGKVWDIKRPVPRTFKPSTESLITELHNRGVTIEQIFGQFYAEEAMADARSDEEGRHGRPLTVGDAELAGFTRLPATPLTRQPF